MTVQPFYLQLVTGYGIEKEIVLDSETGCLSKDQEVGSGDPTPLELALVPLTQFVVSMFFSIFFMQAMT